VGAQGAQGASGPASTTCASATSTFYGGGKFCCDSVKGFSRTFWQQTSGSCSGNGYRYRTEANCLSCSCDWNSYGNFYQVGLIACQQTDATCGNDTSVYSCEIFIYSDVRLKNGIETLEGALETIMKINAVEYDWNKNLNPNMYEFFSKQDKLHTIGLIAQNVRLYYPEAVKMNDDGYYSIDYYKLNSVLVEGIKDLQYEIEDMDKELDKIELILS
jgi:hypothetical protein